MPETESTVEDFRTERICPRCRYRVRPGWYHEEEPQPEGSNVFVCKLKKVPPGLILQGPLVDVLNRFFDERGKVQGKAQEGAQEGAQEE